MSSEWIIILLLAFFHIFSEPEPFTAVPRSEALNTRRQVEFCFFHDVALFRLNRSSDIWLQMMRRCRTKVSDLLNKRTYYQGKRRGVRQVRALQRGERRARENNRDDVVPAGGKGGGRGLNGQATEYERIFRVIRPAKDD